jgi:hypothetical protein
MRLHPQVGYNLIHNIAEFRRCVDVNHESVSSAHEHAVTIKPFVACNSAPVRSSEPAYSATYGRAHGSVSAGGYKIPPPSAGEEFQYYASRRQEKTLLGHSHAATRQR